ncbi:MAG: signal peptidase I [Candidatus Brocadia sp.]|nr:signal peptidase I [Candidatus Brocadia sp.]
MHNPAEKTMQDAVLGAMLNVWCQTKEQHSISITGRSMFPLIREGDQVLVAHGCTGMRRGDVIVFRRRGTLIAHRVLSILRNDAGPIFVTKGDNVPQFDPPLSNNEIVGRVLAVKRGNRCMPLDTSAWRILGWFIAVSTLSLAQIHGCGRNLKQKLFGTYFSCLTPVFHKCEQVFSFFIRKILFAVFCKWKSRLHEK